MARSYWLSFSSQMPLDKRPHRSPAIAGALGASPQPRPGSRSARPLQRRRFLPHHCALEALQPLIEIRVQIPLLLAAGSRL
jgi:hypothetical protein